MVGIHIVLHDYYLLVLPDMCFPVGLQLTIIFILINLQIIFQINQFIILSTKIRQ